jgi:hypothetical protein
MRYWAILLGIILTGCAPAADRSVEIQVAVLQTVAAMPTVTAPPSPAPPPVATPFDLKGVFCEYQFCVGHPLDMAFFDVNAQKNPSLPSVYSQGVIAAFNTNLFIQMIWQLAPGLADPQFMLDLILNETDTRVGTLEVKRVRDMNVIYTPITSSATPLLPFGAAAAWICGERAFAWKVYSPQAETAPALFEQALERFRCSP